jgi:hypothetical protein
LELIVENFSDNNSLTFNSFFDEALPADHPREGNGRQALPDLSEGLFGAPVEAQFRHSLSGHACRARTPSLQFVSCGFEAKAKHQFHYQQYNVYVLSEEGRLLRSWRRAKNNATGKEFGVVGRQE